MFFPRSEDPNNYIDQICGEFERLSFGTQSQLTLLAESRDKLEWWVTLKYGKIKFAYLDEVDIDETIRQIDCYIAGDNPDEIPIIERAWKNRIEIVSFQREGLNVFRDFPIDPKAEAWKSHLKQLVESRLISKFPLEEYEYILAQNGFGETMTLFYFLREYKIQRRRKVCVLCIDASRYEMMLRCPYADVTIRVPSEIFYYLSKFYPVKNLLKLHFNPQLMQIRNSFPKFQNIEPTIIFYVRNFLELDPLTKLSRYHVEIPRENLDNARRIFDSLNLREGKTIYINMRAASYSRLDHHRDFFIRLGEKFRELGFDLVTNSPREEFPNVPNVLLNFWDNVAFVGLCRNVLSVPTGFIEVSCAFNDSAPIQYHVFFPGIYDQYRKPSRGLFRQIQIHGKKFVDATILDYRNFLEQILPKNVNLELHEFPDSEEESRRLIEEIVQKISR